MGQLKRLDEGGEPLFTHSQYRDYNEPSIPDYEEEFGSNSDDENFGDPHAYLYKELKKNGILLAFDEIKCIDPNTDFSVYLGTPKDPKHEVYINGDKAFETHYENVHDLLNFILKRKNMFLPYEEAAKQVSSYSPGEAFPSHNGLAENIGDEVKFSDRIEEEYQEKLMSVINQMGYDDVRKKIAIKAVELLVWANAVREMSGAKSADKLFRQLSDFEQKNNFHDAWEIVEDAKFV